MSYLSVRLASMAGLLLLSSMAPAHATPAIDSNTFGGLRARDIGPAKMSGRIAAIDAVAADPVTVYVGAASGGVWKSTDAGISFKPVFDDFAQSIGAIRVDRTQPKTVWVGTGESWVRNSVSIGNGLYKSIDGGDSWQLMGLANSERIAAIRIHPKKSDIVYVCALGPLWSSGGERGVYKTKDGGKTWEQVLKVDVDTGCADLDIDPQEPEILYASMWQHRRSAHFFTSGGPGSGLFKTVDGGKTWERLKQGLPEGDLGRIAVAVAPSRPNVVYATVEAKESALYRSDDLGRTWTKLDSSAAVTMRPFYFSEMEVDPTDHQRVYKPGFFLGISVDGGKSFSSMFSGGFGGGVHPDHHALWINPTNPQQLFLGTDGGLYVSENRGNEWRHVKSLPVSQFYHVSYDMEFPFNVYGGLQDNGSWQGPSAGRSGFVATSDWESIGFGDGFWSFADPTDSNIIYSEFQGGRLLRFERDTGAIKRIHPFPSAGQEDLRFNWNTPIHLSPNDPGTIYFGSQYLHRSRDRGETWESISPDLTTDDPAKQRQKQSGGLTVDNSTAENHCTIFAIAESPQDRNTIWVGTDDGNVQLTRDGGATWQRLDQSIPLLPKPAWVSSLHASKHDGATAFATFDRHTEGDHLPYVYKTMDFGKTWQALATPNILGYAHVVIQDPSNADLLFLGTELGMWISLDGGRAWARFKENLPQVAVRDLVIHPRDHSLVIATHGRGVYIVDDVTPLRHLAGKALEAEVALLPTKPAPMVITAQGQDFAANDEFLGENPAEAASISYYLKKRHMMGDLKVEILDQEGKIIMTLPGGKRPGLNSVDWPMRLKAPKLPAATNLVPAFIGPRVPEGKYRVRLIKGDKTLEGEVALVADPRSRYSADDRRLQQESALGLYRSLGELAFLTEQLVDLREQAKAHAEKLKASDKKRLLDFADVLEKQRGELVSTSKAGMLSGDEKLREEMGNLYGEVSGYDGRPTNSQLGEIVRIKGALEQAQADIEALLTKNLPSLNQLLSKRGAAELKRLDRATWEAKDQGGNASPALVRAAKKGLLGDQLALLLIGLR